MDHLSPPGPPQQPPVSPDGRWWWDGRQWQPMLQPNAQATISADGRWWWNGTQWQPSAHASAPPSTNPSSTPGPRPNLGPPVGRNPLADVSKGQWIGIAAVTGLVGVLTIIGYAGVASEPSQRPADQVAFLKAVAQGQDRARDATEVQVVEARKQRATEMCQALDKGLTVDNWVGTVAKIETTLGGDSGVLEVLIADDVSMQTTNNALSNLGSDSLIRVDSQVWKALVELEEGDRVFFSGRFDPSKSDCIHESSLMDVNGMKTPDFVFAFSSIGPLGDGPIELAPSPLEPSAAPDANQ